MKCFRVFMAFAIIKYKIALEYSAAFWAGCISQMIWYGVEFLLVWIVVQKFTNIAGWTADEVIFLYALQLVSYAIAGTFFFGCCSSLGYRIQDGSFYDSMVVPMKPLAYEMLSNYNADYIRHIILAVGLLLVSARRIGIVANYKNISIILVTIACGTLIQAGALLLLSAPNFWIVRGDKLLDLFFYNLISFIRYPVLIYPKLIQLFLTFVFPYAFINYYPLIILFDKDSNILIEKCGVYVTPLVAILFFSLGIVIWNIGVRNYQTTGT